MTKTTQAREHLTAIAVQSGIIQLIEPNGNIGFYRQRGIDKYNLTQIKVFIQRGILSKDWNKVKELPKNWSIAFEEPSIMGRAYATFNPDR